MPFRVVRNYPACLEKTMYGLLGVEHRGFRVRASGHVTMRSVLCGSAYEASSSA